MRVLLAGYRNIIFVVCITHNYYYCLPSLFLSHTYTETLQWVLLGPIAQTPCPRDYPSLLGINTKVRIAMS